MNKGYFVKIDRTLPEHWIYDCKPFDYAHAWIDLIMLADIQDHKTLYRGDMVSFKRGDVNISISKLAERWGWSRDKARRFLTLLENDEMVRVISNKHRTTITLVNYGVFQDKPTTDKATDRHQTRQQTDIRPTSDKATDKAHLKNIKNNKEIKEIKENKEEESLPLGAIRLPDGSIDYERWDDEWSDD